jgi:cell division protein FtsN
MMVQQVVSRTQRRIERKQLILIIVLILAVAGVSFSLGVMFGKKGGTLPGLAADVEKPKLPMVTKIAPPPLPTTEAAEDKPEKLTFYDNLPKGNQAPLGSGINLPPERKKPAVASVKKAAVKPASLPAEPLAKTVTAPVAATDGDFVVQVASFRTAEDANKLAGRLKTYKLKAFVESADLGEKGVWYRVLCGPYAGRESADQAAVLLREKERLSALVRQR